VTDHTANGPDQQMPDKKKSYALLVDGYVRELFATGLILQRMDYEVYIVNTAEDALRYIQAAPPALVITELSLPQMSGLELLIRVKQNPGTKAVPVLIHTAAGDSKKEEHCLAAGCASFLRKPVEPDALFRAIQQATEVNPRHHVRLKTLLPVMVGGQTVSGSVVSTECVSELSENGIFVRTLNPRPLKAVLPVTILIHSIPVKLRAVVLRTCTIGVGSFKEPGMGMKFVEISETDRELIRNYIKGQLIKDIPAQ
jgi:CheY-like chemotaxis protein